MATNPEKLNLTVAAATYKDMLRMVDVEKKFRKSLLDRGVTNAEREAFEILPDDARQCEECKTTCFMSAISCKCSPDVLVCLRHFNSHCKCPPADRTLRYRYTLDELLPLLKNLKAKVEAYDRWAEKVKSALDRTTPKALTLQEIKALVVESDTQNFPKFDLIDTLTNAVEDAEKCASVIKQLDLNKIRTRHSNDHRNKLTLEELTLFCEEIDSLACVLDEEKIIKELLEKTNQFEAESAKILETPLQSCNMSDVERCINNNVGLCIDLPSLKPMNERYKQLKWLKEVQACRKSSDSAEIEALKGLLEAGWKLKSDDCILKVLRELQALIDEAQEWEQAAQALLKKSSPDLIAEIQELIREADQIKVYLPTESILLDSLNQANDWFKCLNELNSLEYYPYLSSIEDLIKRTKSFPFHMHEVKGLKACVADAQIWKENTSRIFLRKNSAITLMDALSPRTQIMTTKSKKRVLESEMSQLEFTDDMDSASVVALFKDAEDKEMKAIRSLRSINSSKSFDVTDGDTFCICLKGISGVMMQCELCKDWYHSTCVQLPKIATVRIKGNVRHALLHMGYRDSKFLCTNCHRTRRPRLKSILDLLMALQKLQIRLPEGDALQCLTEHAMSWQDRARQLLKTNEMENALAKIEQIGQKVTEVAKTKTDIRKMVNNSDLMNDKKEIEDVYMKDGEITSDEHAYSLNISNIDDPEGNINVSNKCLEQLEELILEGDLLEVYLEELQQLWLVYHATKLKEPEPFAIDFDVSTKTNRKLKKRRSEEVEIQKPLKQTKVENKKIRTKRVGNNKEGALKRDGSARGRKPRNRQSQNSDDEDENENCASSPCVQPVGEEVHWIQCDGGCELWFHMECVGLSQKDINEDDDYICTACSRGNCKDALDSVNEECTNHVTNNSSPPPSKESC